MRSHSSVGQSVGLINLRSAVQARVGADYWILLLMCCAFKLQRALFIFLSDTVSEWLRSWTRNPMGFARRGSNPLGVDFVS